MSTNTMTGINTAQHIVQTLNSPVRADEDKEDNLIGPEAVDEVREIEMRMVRQVYGERSMSLVAGSFFPSAKSEAGSGSWEWNETNPDSPINISSLFPSNKSETDDSSPEFSRSNSDFIMSIFLPATSPVDSPENNEIIVRNRSIPSYYHLFPPDMSDTDSYGSSTPNHQLSIPSFYQCFPPDRSDTDSHGSLIPMQSSIPSLHFLPNKLETINSSLIVARSRSQAGSTRRATPTTLTSSPSLTAAVNVGVTVAEKPLANGDLYIGGLSGNAPHGSGKYLWTNGCMYEGEWRRGKAYGKGKFSWPSGATYKGDFKSGRMEGLGTFIGSDGATYRGSWSSDRKHGYGERRYANGDFYKGYWKRNVQDGQGRYVWKNRNEYEGEWKNGVISGRGVLVWANGNRYSGEWENGVPKGNGVFTWPDSSCYVGSWNKDLKIQQMNGTFYPGNGNLKSDGNGNGNGGGFDNLMITMRKRSSVDGARGSVTERNFPRIYIWESDGEAGDIGDIIDNLRLPCNGDGNGNGGGIERGLKSDGNGNGGGIEKMDKLGSYLFNLFEGLPHRRRKSTKDKGGLS